MIKKNKTIPTIKSMAGIYDIPGLDCNKNLWLRLLMTLKKENLNNGLVKHSLETIHNFNS